MNIRSSPPAVISSTSPAPPTYRTHPLFGRSTEEYRVYALPTPTAVVTLSVLASSTAVTVATIGPPEYMISPIFTPAAIKS